MIRSLIPGDKEAVLALAGKLGMFDAAGLEHIGETMSEYLGGHGGDLWFMSEDNGLAGVVYAAAEAMTSGTWNVLMLLVNPDHHGQGHGSALMKL